MLLVRVDSQLEPEAREFAVGALLAGVRAELGGCNEVSSLTDPAFVEAPDEPTVLVEPASAAQQSEANVAAAAATVLVVATAADMGQSAGAADAEVNTHAVVGTGQASEYEAGSEQPDAAASPPNAVIELGQGRRTWPTGTRIVLADLAKRRRAAWTIKRLGRELADAACAPQRLDPSDQAVRRRSAAEVAVAAMVDLLDEPGVEEFQIRGGHTMQLRRSGGTHENRPSPFKTDDELIEAVRFLAAYSGDRAQRFDELDPRLDIRVGDSWRLHAEAFVTSPPNVVLRSNMAGKMRVADLGVACDQLQAVLVEAIAGQVRANVVVAASMGGGKTTLCQALLAAVPDHERIDTIEDTPELRLSAYGIHPNAFERLTRDPNQDGHGRHSMADHIRDAKRSNAEKLVVGEIRGDGCEALLDAMSSGISGCLVTLHSMPGSGVLEKLEAYACSEGADPAYARRQIAAAVELLVWMGRNDAGRRVVADVTQLIGIDPVTGVISTRCLWSLKPGEELATPVEAPVGRVVDLYESAGVPLLPAQPLAAVSGTVSLGAQPSNSGGRHRLLAPAGAAP